MSLSALTCATWKKNNAVLLYKSLGSQIFGIYSQIQPLWSSHTKRNANAKATLLYWVLIISILPATPSESESDVTFQLGSVAI